MFKQHLLPTAVATTLLAGATLAPVASAEDWEIAGNVSLVSDYRFRGISQSDEDWALQGGFDAAWSTGIYVGVWGSSVDFDTNGGGFDGSLETDLYVGWSSPIGASGDLSIDVGYMYYAYPGDDDADGDYQEIYGSFSWKDLSIGGAYSDDYYGGTGEFYYVYGDYGLTLGEVGLAFHVGYNDLEKNGGFLSSNTDSYIDYSIGLSYEAWAVEWGLTWVGTDLDKDDVFGTDWAEDTVVFSLSKSL